MYLTGTATVKIGTKNQAFKSEEAYGVALTHGKVTGSSEKAAKSILDDINFQIDKAWKKAKLGGDAPEVESGDIEWDTYSAK
jgi:hypothetical protein